MSFPNTLIRTESGGNWQAYNNEEGAGGHRGHGGRLQFGTARLQDAARAGIIPQMTAAEFARQPEAVQARVEQWHFGDIDRQAEGMGLGRFIGQTVNGVQITQNGIRAMAHLGGIGGARQFLESGGSHNPSDAYGTSLLDYARTHGGSAEYGGASDSGGNSAVPQQPGSTAAYTSPFGQNALAGAQQQQRPEPPVLQNTLDPTAFMQAPQPQNALQNYDRFIS